MAVAAVVALLALAAEKGVEKAKSGSSALVPRVMGVGVTAGALCLKVPQIVAIARAGSTDGISLAGSYMEVPMYSAFALYHARLGYPLDTYGENVAITLQSLVIVGLVWAMRRTGRGHMLAVLAAAAALHGGIWLLPRPLLPVVAQAQPLIMCAGYGPQILLNFKAGCTGQLSALTTAMRFVGCLVRTATTLARLRGDPWVLSAYLVSASLTGVLLAQVLLLPRDCPERL